MKKELGPKQKAFLATAFVIAWYVMFQQIQRSASIYPMNAIAEKFRLSTVKYTPDTSSAGTMYAEFQNGMVLEGDYKQLGKNDKLSILGHIYDLDETGRNKRISGTYMRLYHMSHGAESDDDSKYRGILVGTQNKKKISMQCEFYLTYLSSSGVGACRTSFGADYKIVF